MGEFTNKPITSAETWDVWERVPEHFNHVDFFNYPYFTLLGKSSN